MAKGHRHLKRLKSEKAKIKLKTKKSINHLPKGLNITDTSFKVKKILIREQLKYRDETEILSTRKLNIKDLLMRLRHHNSTVREEALKQLKEILSQNPSKILQSQLSSLLHGIAALSLDKEKDIRKNSLNALNLILGPLSNEQLTPFRKILVSYLNCAMTHIDPRIKEDSLHFLDLLLFNCENILAKDSHKILSNFLGMICRLQDEIKPGRQLTTILNSKNTSIKWRIKVLERLANMFTLIVSCEKFGTTHLNTCPTIAIKAKNYVPIYGSSLTRLCEINFDRDPSSIVNSKGGILSTEEFIKYISILMPLMFDIWLEVCPNEKFENYTEITISNEACLLLKNIIEIIQSIIKYINTLGHNNDSEHIKLWFKNTFHNAYMKNFLLRFPYIKVKQYNTEPRKCQRDFSHMEFAEDCLEQNLGLCQIHIWFTSIIIHNRQFLKSTKDHCVSVVKYLNDTIDNWHVNNLFALSQLTNILRILFLEANSIWYANCINLSDTLQLIVEVSSRLPRKELQSHLSLIIGDIMLESNLNELHREKAFKKFITTLPNLLLESSIDDVTIRMINKIVLRFKEWIKEELITKYEAIIENTKKINIVGSHNDKESRLIIYNLFYFMDAHIYY